MLHFVFLFTGKGRKINFLCLNSRHLLILSQKELEYLFYEVPPIVHLSDIVDGRDIS